MSKMRKDEVFEIIKRSSSRMDERKLFNFRETGEVMEQILIIQKGLGAALNPAKDRFSYGKYYDRSREKFYKRAMIQVKYKKLEKTYKNITKYYVCNTVAWNFWLNRYYPKADLVLEVEHLN